MDWSLAQRLGPLGAKAIGEPANMPITLAISNPVACALCVRIRELPSTSEKVLAAMPGI